MSEGLVIPKTSSFHFYFHSGFSSVLYSLSGTNFISILFFHKLYQKLLHDRQTQQTLGASAIVINVHMFSDKTFKIYLGKKLLQLHVDQKLVRQLCELELPSCQELSSLGSLQPQVGLTYPSFQAARETCTVLHEKPESVIKLCLLICFCVGIFYNFQKNLMVL